MISSRYVFKIIFSFPHSPFGSLPDPSGRRGLNPRGSFKPLWEMGRRVRHSEGLFRQRLKDLGRPCQENRCPNLAVKSYARRFAFSSKGHDLAPHFPISGRQNGINRPRGLSARRLEQRRNGERDGLVLRRIRHGRGFGFPWFLSQGGPSGQNNFAPPLFRIEPAGAVQFSANVLIVGSVREPLRVGAHAFTLWP